MSRRQPKIAKNALFSAVIFRKPLILWMPISGTGIAGFTGRQRVCA
ncbi:MAG: hypothetical protein NUV55_03690 [Sulfuricaulis sp.]|nr:hypothetical protein [Sulfuricaulis sp.]